MWPPPAPSSSHDPTIALGVEHQHRQPHTHTHSHAHMFAVQLVSGPEARGARGLVVYTLTACLTSPDLVCPLLSSHGPNSLCWPPQAALLPRLAWQLRSWLRPAYLDCAFLARAGGRCVCVCARLLVDRYERLFM